ncbi:MAG: NADP-dependent oxidoreductase [Pseudonocardia sp.]|uniref:NADP-dependent oxidoreductase n=1 Tax=unclassified Pseudonocardia TaxID=2619320 RepID=UPI001AC915A0|nr:MULTISPECIES: NADP-dependent oxidoreductase [unclassified Pseudonocardia]MBN9110714.1 NADP-dependent oxidoreductase [Pseudonocardia sp.]
MKAMSQDRAGGPEVLTLVDHERPEAGPTEILVRVEAAGINPTDWKTRGRGYFYHDEKPPFTLGFDVSGIVEAVGPGVTIFAPGDKVIGMPRFPRPAGAYAEFVTGPARHFTARPESLDAVHGAALPLAGLTAWQALVDTAALASGQRVLVHAAAGGVGHLAVQIAKARGAYVIGTASAAKHDILRGLGADELVDYRTQDFADVVSDVDVVLDTLGGDVTGRSLSTLREGGILVSIIPPPGFDSSLMPSRDGVRVTWMLVEPDRTGLAELTALVDEKKLQVVVDSTFPLASAADAHRQGETGRTTGKLVLTIPG